MYPVCGWKFRLHVHRRLQQRMHIDRAHWYVARSFNISPLDGSYFHFCCACGEGLTKESRFFHLLANPCFAGDVSLRALDSMGFTVTYCVPYLPLLYLHKWRVNREFLFTTRRCDCTVHFPHVATSYVHVKTCILTMNTIPV